MRKTVLKAKFELEKVFARSVDQVMSKAIKNNRMKNYIFAIKREVYAA